MVMQQDPKPGKGQNTGGGGRGKINYRIVAGFVVFVVIVALIASA